MSDTSISITIPRMMQTGMVKIQALTMLPTVLQRTALKRRLAPTPTMAVLITWVVLTGKPRREAVSMTVAALVSAAKPWMGLRSTILLPIVLIIRHPPDAVPAA